MNLRSLLTLFTIFAVASFAGASAAAQSHAHPADGAEKAERPGAEEGIAGAHVVEVAATDYAFQMPETVPSGWTTFRFDNEGEEHHFMLLMRLPEGKTFDDYVLEVGEPFNDVWYPLRDGEITQEEAFERLGEVLPEWFWAVEQMGGPGMLAPGESGEATVKLEPGNYVVECYMKTPEGEFHGLEGMLDPLTVTEEPSEGSPPAADVRLTVTNDGIAMEHEVTAGRHTVEVHFAEQAEGFWHNVNLARLDADTEVDRVVHWVNWANVDGLQPPAPVSFLGGVREMPAGYTGYFTVDVVPGRYLWISETTAAQGILKEFTVR